MADRKLTFPKTGDNTWTNAETGTQIFKSDTQKVYFVRVPMPNSKHWDYVSFNGHKFDRSLAVTRKAAVEIAADRLDQIESAHAEALELNAYFWTSQAGLAVDSLAAMGFSPVNPRVDALTARVIAALRLTTDGEYDEAIEESREIMAAVRVLKTEAQMADIRAALAMDQDPTAEERAEYESASEPNDEAAYHELSSRMTHEQHEQPEAYEAERAAGTGDWGKALRLARVAAGYRDPGFHDHSTPEGRPAGWRDAWLEAERPAQVGAYVLPPRGEEPASAALLGGAAMFKPGPY